MGLASLLKCGLFEIAFAAPDRWYFQGLPPVLISGRCLDPVVYGAT